MPRYRLWFSGSDEPLPTHEPYGAAKVRVGGARVPTPFLCGTRGAGSWISLLLPPLWHYKRGGLCESGKKRCMRAHWRWSSWGS